MKKTLLSLLVCLATVLTHAQTKTRYLDADFFTTVKMDTTITYGQNFSILAKLNAALPKTNRIALLMDVYSPPAADVETKRPLVIYIHTGNFLPANAVAPNGSRRDSTPVEVCTRMAKMGYVAASIDYRVGWAPTIADELIKRHTLINAAYRGFQDLHTAVRFFKKNAETYGIDTNKIVVWGHGSGSYISYAASNARDSIKFENTTHGQRKFFVGQNKMIQPWVNGDIEGKSFTIAPANYWDTILKPIDTMCVSNHPANTSNFHMSINLGGALGDLSWIDNNSIPTISFQTPYDLAAPFQDAVLTVNTARGPEPVIRVQGADSVQRKMDLLKRNTAFTNIKTAYDPYKSIFDARNKGFVAGLFPMLGDTISDNHPWDFWAASNPRNAQGLATNPRMSAARARKYIDTLITVIAPRACVVLNLPCANLVSSTEELLQASSTKLIIAPNPASSTITFESDVYNPIQAIELFDLSGRSMRLVRNIKNHQYQLDRGSLPDGLYIAKVKFEGGIIAKKVLFGKQE